MKMSLFPGPLETVRQKFAKLQLDGVWGPLHVMWQTDDQYHTSISTTLVNITVSQEHLSTAHAKLFNQYITYITHKNYTYTANNAPTQPNQKCGKHVHIVSRKEALNGYII